MATTDRRPTRTSRLRRAEQYALFALLFVLPDRDRARALQWMDGRENLFAEESLNHNMGYWADAPASLDEASNALADLVAAEAGFDRADSVLDVGCGFGDQDGYWHDVVGVPELVGVDVMAFKVAEAARRFSGRPRLSFSSCRAESLPFGADRFDAVVAVESSFHFVTRADFCREARRVLRPGGRLVVVEPICLPATTTVGRVIGAVERAVVATPKRNVYGLDEYAGMVAAAGFREVGIRSIRDAVFPPFMQHLERRLADPDVVARVNPLVRALWKGWAEQVACSGVGDTQDYVVVRAVA